MNTIFRNFFSILDKKNKKIFLILSILSIFGAVLEMIGVGILIPIVVLITEPSALEISKKIKFLEGYDNFDILNLVSIFLLFFFIVKCFFITILYKKIFYWIGDLSCQF